MLILYFFFSDNRLTIFYNFLTLFDNSQFPVNNYSIFTIELADIIKSFYFPINDFLSNILHNKLL
jgi:hypothetical protein